MLSFEEYLQLSKTNALAGEDGAKPISVGLNHCSDGQKEGIRVLAESFADIPPKGDGYVVVSRSSESEIFGSVNKDGIHVGKRMPPKQKSTRRSKRIHSV